MKKPVLIFDLDDTLVDSESAYERALQTIGLSKKNEEFLIARSEVKKTLGDGHVSARNRWLYIKRILENKNEFSAAKVIQAMQRYEDALIEDIGNQWISLKRDSLFQKLRQDFSLAILTNENTRTQLLKLSAMDPLGQYFSCVLTSEEVGFEKPRPEIFEAVLKRYSSDKIGQITFIGDSLKNDVEPSLQLGWSVIWTQEFLGEKIESSYPGVTIINKLDEILNILELQRNKKWN